LARAGAKVGLIDADIYGPSIPTMFNCEFEQPAVKQVNGKNINYTDRAIRSQTDLHWLSHSPDSAVVWRGPMASAALKQFFSDADWVSSIIFL
jgi:ATP-binding protein involved in chromosome partitioning